MNDELAVPKHVVHARSPGNAALAGLQRELANARRLSRAAPDTRTSVTAAALGHDAARVNTALPGRGVTIVEPDPECLT